MNFLSFILKDIWHFDLVCNMFSSEKIYPEFPIVNAIKYCSMFIFSKSEQRGAPLLNINFSVENIENWIGIEYPADIRECCYKDLYSYPPATHLLENIEISQIYLCTQFTCQTFIRLLCNRWQIFRTKCWRNSVKKLCWISACQKNEGLWKNHFRTVSKIPQNTSSSYSIFFSKHSKNSL